SGRGKPLRTALRVGDVLEALDASPPGPRRSARPGDERLIKESLRRRRVQVAALRLGTNTMFPFCLSVRSAASEAHGFVSRRKVVAAVLLAFFAGWTTTARAQSTSRGRYFPLDQSTPPGVAGQWSAIRPGYAMVMQPVRVEVVGQGGQVGVYT